MGALKLLIQPISGLLSKRQERKQARETAISKLQQTRQDGNLQVELNDQELERVLAGDLSTTWKDEYVTVSLVSIINIIIVGGVANAFGYPQLLEGIVQAIVTLYEVGVDIGFLLEAVVLAAVGLTVWRKA